MKKGFNVKEDLFIFEFDQTNLWGEGVPFVAKVVWNGENAIKEFYELHKIDYNYIRYTTVTGFYEAKAGEIIEIREKRRNRKEIRYLYIVTERGELKRLCDSMHRRKKIVIKYLSGAITKEKFWQIVNKGNWE